ncbi:MAG TPA: VOC family protein [Nitrospiraceae bacterium]|nr:VOC family protein [Nitrospiraceae bacterium]
MLGNKNAIATIAVKDMNVAARFYEGTLGLTPLPAVPGVLSYKSGNSTVLVYESQYARTNKATAATWAVGDDVEGVVKSLKAKGVTFERYDLPGTTQTDDVLVSGKIKAAWFKDPDGNILQLVNG